MQVIEARLHKLHTHIYTGTINVIHKIYVNFSVKNSQHPSNGTHSVQLVARF